MKARAYVAGPISQGDLAANICRAHDAATELVRGGRSPYVPHGTCFWNSNLYPGGAFKPEVTHSGFAHEDWLAVGFGWVAASDALLRLPGKSTGADREAAFAALRGVPVFHSDGEVVAWANNPEACRLTLDAGVAHLERVLQCIQEERHGR